MLRLYGNNRINRPVQYPNDSVHMVRHDDKFVNFRIYEMVRDFAPKILRNLAQF